MKALSPLVAVILLIAFTVAIGGIISVWITGFTNIQTTGIGTSGGQLIKCGDIVLDITAVDNSSFTGTASGFNVTVLYKLGSEQLYNFTFFVSGANNLIGRNFSSDFLKTGTAVTAFKPGELQRFSINVTPPIPSPLTSVRVSALCQEQFPVSVEEKCCEWSKS